MTHFCGIGTVRMRRWQALRAKAEQWIEVAYWLSAAFFSMPCHVMLFLTLLPWAFELPLELALEFSRGLARKTFKLTFELISE